MSALACRECGVSVAKKPSWCAECRRIYNAAYRERRRAAGVRSPSGSKTWAPEKRQAWHAKYRGSERARAIRRRANEAYRVRPQHSEKIRARGKVYHAVKNGRIMRGPCEVCGVVKAQAHHDDYSQPLIVRWLCPKHHRAADEAKAEIRAAELPEKKRA